MKTKKDAPLWDALFIHVLVVDEWVLDGDYTQFSLSSVARQPGRFSEQKNIPERMSVFIYSFFF